MRYRRNLALGGTFFFTVVTWRRQPFFADEANICLLRNAIEAVKKKHPFCIDAMVVLPDHVHCIWSLPSGDGNYPLRWRLIKTGFTKHYNSHSGTHLQSLGNTGDAGVVTHKLWQPRYWEHTIANDNDLARYIDYIHYNPVKHGYAATVREWKLSSFHRYVAAGVYPANWTADPSSFEWASHKSRSD